MIELLIGTTCFAAGWFLRKRKDDVTTESMRQSITRLIEKYDESTKDDKELG